MYSYLYLVSVSMKFNALMLILEKGALHIDKAVEHVFKMYPSIKAFTKPMLLLAHTAAVGDLVFVGVYVTIV